MRQVQTHLSRRLVSAAAWLKKPLAVTKTQESRVTFCLSDGARADGAAQPPGLPAPAEGPRGLEPALRRWLPAPGQQRPSQLGQEKRRAGSSPPWQALGAQAGGKGSSTGPCRQARLALILLLAPQHGRQNRDPFALRGTSCRTGLRVEGCNHPPFNITPTAGGVPVPRCKGLQADAGETSNYKIHFLPLIPKSQRRCSLPW